MWKNKRSEMITNVKKNRPQSVLIFIFWDLPLRRISLFQELAIYQFHWRFFSYVGLSPVRALT